MRTLTAIEAPADELDDLLLGRVAPMAADEPISFLRANKPAWGIELTRHTLPLEPAETDAVADSALVLERLRLEAEGNGVRPRREWVLLAMREVASGLTLSAEERLRWHREGYAWALELGRWDDAGIAALEARFDALRDGLVALFETTPDPVAQARWSLLERPPGDPARAIEEARRLVSHHANRLGVFAEAEAILHFLVFRLGGGTHASEAS